MTDETENLTIRLLQELRAQIEQTNARIDRVNERIEDFSDRFTDLTQRIDGNTLVFNLVAGVVHQHDERITDLEQRGV